MATTTINVRIEEETKRDVEELLDKLGLNISTLVNMTFKQLLMDEALPFLPRYKPNENMKARKSLLNAIDEAHNQALAGGLSEDMSLDQINTLISEARNA